MAKTSAVFVAGGIMRSLKSDAACPRVDGGVSESKNWLICHNLENNVFLPEI
jgi:hypothetical protein